MKCKICGFEYSDSKLICPMCGTQRDDIDSSKADILNWNNRDFPKPKFEEPLEEKNWSSLDVTEGYVEVPHFESEKKQEKFYTFQTKNEEFQKLLDKEFERLKEIQNEENERAKSRPVFPSDFARNSFNKEEYARDVLPATPKKAFADTLKGGFVSSDASGFIETNAKSIDENKNTQAFENIKIYDRNKVGSKEEEIFTVPQPSIPAKAYPNRNARNTRIIEGSLSNDAFNDMLEKDTEDADNLPRPSLISDDVKPVAKPASSTDMFDINVLEHTIQQIEEEEVSAMKESEARRKKLEAMAAARDAYFQCLDEDYKKPQGLFASRKAKQLESMKIADVANDANATIKQETAIENANKEARVTEPFKVTEQKVAQSAENTETVKPVLSEAKNEADVAVDDQWLNDYLNDYDSIPDGTAKFNKKDFRAEQKKWEAQYFAAKHGHVPKNESKDEEKVQANDIENFEEIIGQTKEIKLPEEKIESKTDSIEKDANVLVSQKESIPVEEEITPIENKEIKTAVPNEKKNFKTLSPEEKKALELIYHSNKEEEVVKPSEDKTEEPKAEIKNTAPVTEEESPVIPTYTPSWMKKEKSTEELLAELFGESKLKEKAKSEQNNVKAAVNDVKEEIVNNIPETPVVKEEIINNIPEVPVAAEIINSVPEPPVVKEEIINNIPERPVAAEIINSVPEPPVVKEEIINNIPEKPVAAEIKNNVPEVPEVKEAIINNIPEVPAASEITVQHEQGIEEKAEEPEIPVAKFEEKAEEPEMSAEKPVEDLFDSEYQKLFAHPNKTEADNIIVVQTNEVSAGIEGTDDTPTTEINTQIRINEMSEQKSVESQEEETIEANVFEELMEDNRTEEERKFDTKPSYEFVLAERIVNNSDQDEEYYDDSEYIDDEDEEYYDDEDEDYDDEDDDEDTHKGGFVKFVAGVVIVLAIVKGGVFGMEKLMPDKEITQTVVNIASSVEEAVASWAGSVAESIEGIFNK